MKEQVCIRLKGQTRQALYRSQYVNGEWAPVWHHCTISDAKNKVANGAELHPKSLPLEFSLAAGDHIVYTAKSGATYSATVTAVTTFGVAILCATGERFFEEKRTAEQRCQKFPAGSTFFVPAS